MSVFGITLLVAVVLFIREEILSSLCRKELQRANEAYDAYQDSLRRERLWDRDLLEDGGHLCVEEGGRISDQKMRGREEECSLFPAA